MKKHRSLDFDLTTSTAVPSLSQRDLSRLRLRQISLSHLSFDPSPPITPSLDVSHWSPPPSSLIGEGGTSLVYRGRYRREECVVKILRRNKSCTERYVASFLKEIVHMGQLGSRTTESYCLDLLGSYVEESVLESGGHVEPGTFPLVLLVTPYYPSGSLYELIHDDVAINGRLRLDLLLQIALGLAHVHSRGFIHGDMKSLNILLKENTERRSYDAVLSDFGFLQRESQEEIEPRGSILWMAPETLRQESPKLFVQSDIWGLGIIACEMANRQKPYAETSLDLLEVKAAVADGSIVPRVDLECEEDGGEGARRAKEILSQVVSLCCVRAPEERCSVSEVIRLLTAAISEWSL